eukprot:8046119-Karenia_brevis.AAC.1
MEMCCWRYVLVVIVSASRCVSTTGLQDIESVKKCEVRMWIGQLLVQKSEVQMLIETLSAPVQTSVESKCQQQSQSVKHSSVPLLVLDLGSRDPDMSKPSVSYQRLVQSVRVVVVQVASWQQNCWIRPVVHRPS